MRKKELLTQSCTRKPCVGTEKPTGTQDNFKQSKEDGGHCVDTEKSLCIQGKWCVDTTLFDWLQISSVHKGFCVLTQDFLVSAFVRSFFLVDKATF